MECLSGPSTGNPPGDRDHDTTKKHVLKHNWVVIGIIALLVVTIFVSRRDVHVTATDSHEKSICLPALSDTSGASIGTCLPVLALFFGVWGR